MAKAKQTLNSANNAFGFELLTSLGQAHPQTNLFISPASLVQALALCWNGADGRSAAQIAQALQLDTLKQADVNQQNAALWRTLASTDPQVLLAMANSVWAKAGLKLQEPFVNQARQFYAAEVQTIDFAQANAAAEQINQWTAVHTHDKIKTIASPADLLAASVVLVNALYFKGQWQDAFEPEKTRPRPFTLADGRKVSRRMMSRHGEYGYVAEPQFQLIALPFGAGKMSLTILLPAMGLDVGKFMSKVTAVQWQKWHKQVQPRFFNAHLKTGELILPRFTLEWRGELLRPLAKMGLEAALLEQVAEGEKLVISKLIHKTFLEVNEQGAKAAAVTEVDIALGMAPTAKPFRMVVDRPFFCTIQDIESDVILFMGLVYNPEDKSGE